MEISKKWGFGMAPVKSKTDKNRASAIGIFQRFCEAPLLNPPVSVLESISEVKGLFTCVWKQDQWDWFTVFDRLGRPGLRKSKLAIQNLNHLRSYLMNKEGSDQSLDDLKGMVLQDFHSNFQKHLKFYTGEWVPKNEVGQIYILSTREKKDILKIGYTDRSVWERVKEINSATGVLIPYGVRAVWAVESAKEALKNSRLLAQ